ncbi:uncharacterized protein LOC125947757 [Dermacentor silvarum]|uniref:uncharacterized protein LOC125947757 n=1 Tax=Dermacentor silvarum TaxID=543639 RepID=UPI002100E6DF|nr:uncharacterized protein LOC125947757 [Dermacentor silvarum]
MLSLRRGERSCSQGNELRPAMPDASSTTCTDYPRRPQRPHSRDRSKRLSDEIRQQELLERFRVPLKVAFVTTACFGWNSACVFARSSDSWLSRILSLPTSSQQWTMKAILGFAHGSNALSDVILMVGLYCVSISVT